MIPPKACEIFKKGGNRCPVITGYNIRAESGNRCPAVVSEPAMNCPLKSGVFMRGQFR